MVLGQVDAPLQQQTINAQLSPGQNRQSSPLITLAYHGLESLVIAGQERLTDWLRIPAPPCLPPRPLEPARRRVWQLCCHGRFSRDPERGRTLHRPIFDSGGKTGWLYSYYLLRLRSIAKNTE